MLVREKIDGLRGTTGEHVRRMLKRARLLTRPPLPRRDVPLSQARVFQSSLPSR